MAPALSYWPDGDVWLFSALPGDLQVIQNGTTNEDPPRAAWVASVPATDGTVRRYCSDSQDGPFVSIGGHGMLLEKYGSGYRERLRDSLVYYDSGGKIERVERRGTVHSYTYDEDVVWIEANTQPLTKMRCDLSGGRVTTLTHHRIVPGGGWASIFQADVTWDGSHVTQIATAPDGASTSFGYYPDGPLSSYEDCNGQTTLLRYEEAE